MKIRAVRLREVGVFRDPVAVEGLSGGLDVLAGPNELGKSTILRALDRLFLYQPSSKHKDVEQLRPHGGGAPLIEADFEARGRLWRLRKQFLLGRGNAELIDLATGQTRERGPEAHARALELIGVADDGGRGPLGLLWVAQSDGPRPVAVGDDQRTLLLAAIGAEVAEVAGGHALRQIKERVGEELAVLVTGKTRKPKADYDAVLKEYARLTLELRNAQELARLGEERRAELERLRAQHAQLTDPARQAAASQALAGAKLAIEEGRRAREQHKLALGARQTQESQRARLGAEHKMLRERLAEQARLAAELTDLTTRIAAAERAGAASAQAADTGNAHRSKCETELEQARDRLRRREQADILADLRKRLSEARSAASEQTRMAAEIAAIAATDGLVRKAQAEQSSIQALQATLDAAAPRVVIAYAPSVQGAIAVNGRSVAGGTELRPTQPLVLDIAGVGQVTITPVAAVDLGDVQADLDAHREELAETLSLMGVADLDIAREALARRRDFEAHRTSASSRLASLAPEGLAGLEQATAQAERAISSGVISSEPLPPRAEIEEQVRSCDRAYRDAVQAAAAATRGSSEHLQTLTRLRATAEAARARSEALAAELSVIEEPAARLSALEAELAQATADANAAVREVSAWAEAAPTDATWAALQATLQRHEQTQARSVADGAALSQAMARLEGELARGGESDIAERIDELTGAQQSARAKAEHFGKEVAALSLLERLIDESAASSQARYLAPVLARIEPYLSAVLPQARLHLSTGFSPAGLARDGGTEATATLSGGTQEQLAILTRLGFGRLLADRGQAAPVILDDALVYSDDTRIERLFEVLRTASQHHQVIVLTCRSRLFETLGGTPLQITPWKVEM
jgi:DNA repair exonuclease SbcCD ATPase subunit